jgi:hypothetical protein
MKCAHPGCKCDVPESRASGDYCSDHCRKAGDKTEPHCTCGHVNCG